MRTAIYMENERHSLLEKRVFFYSRNVPKELRPPLTLIQRIDTLIIPDILFATASAKLREASFRVLDSFCMVLTSRNIDSMIIDGHTDSVGTLLYNNKLSEDRAGSVFSYIKGKLSLDESFFKIHHYAYLRPVASNITAGGRQRNRRVEIYLYTHD
jgi:outer membrane protein OmpA-like peptidoglycan-associated protein